VIAPGLLFGIGNLALLGLVARVGTGTGLLAGMVLPGMGGCAIAALR
jgi:hypothetical protein